MGEARIHFQARQPDADKAFGLLETALEDEGLPVAISEIDEEKQIFEISVYTMDDLDGVRKRVAELLVPLAPDLDLQIEELPDIDWVSHSLEGLRAVRVGRFFVHGAHERGQERPGEIGIQIDAGLAFGTGHHGTTSGCLEMIERVVTAERPRNALDLGTGSAVLAIAVARLARIPVLATDIDAIATRVARDNVRLNKVGTWVKAETAPGFHHPAFARAKRFDLIVANILARPLMALAPQMAQHVASGGSIILSGILERQRQAVIAAYVGQGFRHLKTLHREGWVAIHMKR
ncbi:50S ribosomal protein L11 methyltransferase [Nitratireductor luteus]|uniref:50S ribosomal protein L11 methyltransferase n=1 Tax=Nitratireductor luteus TaxID=2976980 RepID=UPI00224030E0|nr:50S ribosomal protein L11 methyltransferase [Nitratireductor luteus]